ncbi:hypothetical protein PPTG_17768 [Phytophthora nicotianae INRA-310]|uniref:Uncharacterized protein n=1 Tax=Phytophthora nicotianae (strain INRA-310) TaxID=761204 RepID=W2PKX5_PHYN3|nr:hypothetical protein PPTG_17768 [Phytophthora nicotianae INRA-310]ETN00884.1 hypothetical protein PPTG_17768 [Phytophthora nicotianae INRA-310]
MALAGQHKGKKKKPTIALEAVADYDLRIWHYKFGSPGSLNDIFILEQSSLFDSTVRGEALQVTSTVNISRPARASGHYTIEQLIVHTSKLRNARAHARHRDDLIEHLWQLFKEIFQCTSIYATVMLVMSDSLRAVLAASDDATAVCAWSTAR